MGDHVPDELGQLVSLLNENHQDENSKLDHGEAQTEYLFLLRVDKEARALTSQGKLKSACKLLAGALGSRRQLYGARSEHVSQAERYLAQLYNQLGMACLQRDEHERSASYLGKADSLLKTHTDVFLRVQTLNNLACCHRKNGRVRTALRVLRQALALLHDQQAADDRCAVTHLNVCAVLSQLGRHREACYHARAAIRECKRVLFHGKLDQLTELVVVLCVAYHNVGVELEYMKDMENARVWYKKAYRLAGEHLGPDAPLTVTFRDSVQQSSAPGGSSTTKGKGRQGSAWLGGLPGRIRRKMVDDLRNTGMLPRATGRTNGGVRRGGGEHKGHSMGKRQRQRTHRHAPTRSGNWNRDPRPVPREAPRLCSGQVYAQQAVEMLRASQTRPSGYSREKSLPTHRLGTAQQGGWPSEPEVYH